VGRSFSEKPTCRRKDVSVRVVIDDGEWRQKHVI
jgi:hypothetical protein